MKKKIASVISLLIGIIIFGIIIWSLGIDSIKSVYQQSNPLYLIPYAVLAFLNMVFLSVKLKYILNVHKQKISLINSLRYTLAGFGVSYLTPSARIGGEPLKTYMMNKESNIPYRAGGSGVIIDKFIEILGVAIVAIAGFFLLFLIPGVGFNIKLLLFGMIFLGILLLFFIYYWTINGKGPFTTLFNLLRFYKFKRFKKFSKFIKDVEKRMAKFFIHHKKEFFISLLIYGLVVLTGFLEFKFLLLALGFKASLTEIVLAHVVLGISSLLPVPAGLGFQEAGHSGLFALLRNAGGLGLIFSLIIRVRNLIITGIGFIILANFSRKEIVKKYYGKNRNN